MRKGFLVVLIFFSLLALPAFANEDMTTEMVKAHFKPFGIYSSEDEKILSGETWLNWQKVYLANRKEIVLKSKASLKAKPSLSVTEALSAYPIKKEALHLPQAFNQKKQLTEKEGLFLLRRIDTYYGYPDVLVYGSELESISAGLSAKKEGLEVVLLYEKPRLGGLAINGALNYIDIPQSDGKWLLQGFAKTFHKALGNGYDLEKARRWLDNTLRQNDVLVKKATRLKQVDLEKGEIKRLSFEDKTYYPKMVIDASENGDLMPFVGADFSKGLYEDEEIYPAASLLYILEGVDYKKVSQFLNKRAKEEGLFEGSLNRTAWGYKKEMEAYQVKDKDNVVRGLNIAYIKEKDKVVINHLFNTSINPLDEASKRRVSKSLKEEITYLLPYLKTHLVGFENAKLSGFANELYLRDSRHFKGSHILSLEDIINRNQFFDRVVITNYPIDIHATKDRKENLILYHPQSYEIPYRVMHDEVHKNFLVTSKCASYSPLVAGSTRIVMTGVMVSEAGGLAASLAIKEGKSVQNIPISTLQAKLIRRGFLSNHYSPLKKHLSQDELRILETGQVTYEEVLKERLALKHFFINSSI